MAQRVVVALHSNLVFLGVNCTATQHNTIAAALYVNYIVLIVGRVCTSMSRAALLFFCKDNGHFFPSWVSVSAILAMSHGSRAFLFLDRRIE